MDDGIGRGAFEESEVTMSSGTISSVSESEASVSDIPRGDPANGASRLKNVRQNGLEETTLMPMPFVYSFSPR